MLLLGGRPCMKRKFGLYSVQYVAEPFPRWFDSATGSLLCFEPSRLGHESCTSRARILHAACEQSLKGYPRVNHVNHREKKNAWTYFQPRSTNQITMRHATGFPMVSARFESVENAHDASYRPFWFAKTPLVGLKKCVSEACTNTCSQ